MVKKSSKKQQQKENWPSAFKAIGLSAVARGQLVQFGILIVAGIVAWQMKSEDVVSIIEIFTKSTIFNTLGWVLFVCTIVGMSVLLRGQRNMYLREIDRIAEERNHWQSIANNKIETSEFKVK